MEAMAVTRSGSPRQAAGNLRHRFFGFWEQMRQSLRGIAHGKAHESD
jgi:hypothetical protein